MLYKIVLPYQFSPILLSLIDNMFPYVKKKKKTWSLHYHDSYSNVSMYIYNFMLCLLIFEVKYLIFNVTQEIFFQDYMFKHQLPQ